jgi:amino acid permease
VGPIVNHHSPGSPDVSAPALRHELRARDYFTLAFGSIVGVGWMIVLDDWLGRGGPAGA